MSIRGLRFGFVYLVGASLGVWVVGFLEASGRGSALTASLAVNAFLIGFAWFVVFGLVALVNANAARLGLVLDEKAVDRALRWWVPFAAFTFPLGVVAGPEVPWLGPLARAAGVLLLYPAWLWVRAMWRAAPSGRAGRTWRTAASWFGLTALSTAAVAARGSDALVLAGRQGVVIHLHSLFVGFVTPTALMLYAQRPPLRALDAHAASLLLMVGGLVVVSAGSVTTGLTVAAVGALSLWAVGLWWTGRLWGELE